MEENSEVLLKYQKLALEYSKLKAQTSVLKTAIADEQTTAVELQEALKKKDQFIRKLEQEVECLNFRNLQLTKRVSILQTDLEGVDANPRNSKTKHSANVSVPVPDTYDVLNVELQSRIEENEKLHKQVYAADLEHRKEISELSSTVENLQSELSEQERKLNEKIKEQEALINTLQKEKIKMQVCIKNHEDQIKSQKMKDETKTNDITFEKEDLTLQLDEATKIISNKILFNDAYVDYLNKLNVPMIQREKHGKLSQIMIKMDVFITDFTRQIADLYAFMIQRLCSSSSDSSIKGIVVKLESYLRESIPCIKTVGSNFANVLSAVRTETITWDKSSVLEFSGAFQKYVLYLDKLLPFLILRIQNKESWTGSMPKILELMPKLICLTRKILQCLKKLNIYIQLLVAVVSGSVGKDVYYATQPTILQKIILNLEFLQALFDESRSLFGSKIAVEHQMPMISQSEKNTDECILSTLVSLSSSLKKIIHLMRKDADLLSFDVWYKPKFFSKQKNLILHPCIGEFKEKGSKYIQHIGSNESPSIPYEVALKNYQTLCDYSDNQENLTQQLEQCRNKLMQLELDKENWMLECQLMKAKESKNPEATSDCEEQKASGYNEIHSFVKTTVNQLVKQIQFADSKCISFKNECETLHQKLKMSIEKKEHLENEFANSRQTIDRIKEEQKTLMQSYEEQLNTMSEHLANLNETLTSQKDEIDALKQAGNNKGTKKGKSK